MKLRFRSLHLLGSSPSVSSSNNQGAVSNFKNGNVTPVFKPSDTCQICGKRGHLAIECFHRFNHAYVTTTNLLEALSSLTISDPSDLEWYPDSGATAHMTSNPGIFLSLKPYYGSERVLVGNGSCLLITHSGPILPHSSFGSILLKDVLLVPGLTKNLLSVRKFSTDSNCYFFFSFPLDLL